MALDVRKPPVSFQTFGPSGPNHSPGLVPDPGSTAGTTRFLREDGAFAGVTGSSSAYTPPGTGAVTTTVGNELALGFLHAKDFGATGNGSTDDTTALQNWLNACSFLVLPGWLDAGTYLISSQLNITAAISLFGPGGNAAVIEQTSATANGIVITTLGQIYMTGFQIQGSAAATGGDLLQLNSGFIQPNQFSTFRDVRFQSGWNQFHCVSGSGFTVDNCKFLQPQNIGAWVQCKIAPDDGDSTICNSTFSGLPATGTAILQTSSGGLRVANNKVIQWDIGYSLSLDSGVATSELWIIGNSIESCSQSGLIFRQNAGNVFGTMHIIGNEIAANICINMDDTAHGWLNNVVIDGNTLFPTVVSPATTGYGAVISAALGNFIIGDNDVVPGSGGTTVGFLIRAGVANGVIDGNFFGALSAAIQNSATGVIIRNNPGYNPVGVSTPTPDPSPWNYTVGASPETLYMASTSTMGSIIIAGANINPAAGIATTYTLPVQGEPLGTIIINYTGTLVVHRQIH